jgi:endonuclease IV
VLKDRGINAGLHFWGLVNKNLQYNLAYPDEKIQQESLSKIKLTIDIAQAEKFRYVNVHPGHFKLVGLDINQGSYYDLGKEVSKKEGLSVFRENIKILHQYSQKRGVLFLIETIGARDYNKWYDENSRKNPLNLKAIDINTLINIAQQGYYITNDLCHTLSNFITNDRSFLIQKLMEMTLKLEKQTRLIHVNTTKPPFTGVDTHNGILDEDFNQDVLPTKSQYLQLLSIFKNRDDVWLIPEPLEKHEENFLALEKLVASV